MRGCFQMLITGMLTAALLLVLCAFVLMIIGGQPTERCKIVGDHEIVTNSCIPYCPPKPSECG